MNAQLITNQIIRGNAIELMPQYADESVDMMVVDPPYNLSEGNSLDMDGDSPGEFGGAWDQTNEGWDQFDADQFSQFNRNWIGCAYDILKPGGSIWVFGTYHNIGHVNVMLSEAGFELNNEIIWFKRNAFPNLQCNRFTASHESILWAVKPGADYTFNYPEIKEQWAMPEDHINEPGKQVRSVWDIPNNKTEIELEYEHPTQKPLRVLERVIRSTSERGDLIMDPFCGTGSTCVSAALNGRNYHGIEADPDYASAARDYVADVTEKPEAVEAVVDPDA